MQGEMSIIDHTGDTKLMWDSDNKDEVDDARRTFNDLRKKNYLAYEVKKKGGKGEIMDELDPRVERIILSPPMVGG